MISSVVELAPYRPIKIRIHQRQSKSVGSGQRVSHGLANRRLRLLRSRWQHRCDAAFEYPTGRQQSGGQRPPVVGFTANPLLVNGNMVAGMYDTLGRYCLSGSRRNIDRGIISIFNRSEPYEDFISLDSLSSPSPRVRRLRPPGTLPLTPAASIEIPHSTGKFDFLRIDSKRHRLLAAHENDGTDDYIDLQKNS